MADKARLQMKTCSRLGKVQRQFPHLGSPDVNASRLLGCQSHVLGMVRILDSAMQA